ncbi:serine/threonine-protein kinase PITSLRE [Phlebotomus argentipes]|uniref:serine/threonine-protein kinase PITSLRE n=1 Tax=Phlebotomus argentipes TaxID=94469 RepID=UPI002892BD9A|nr:serine/threonine-protein kinase PITSLRE [Phlebotomus argentipes]
MSAYEEGSGADDISEDGQVRSPDNNDESFGEAEGTEDSLDIKPPQATRHPGRIRDKRREYKEKRHMRDHRHRSGHERPERHDRRHSGHHGRGEYHHQPPRRHDERKHYGRPREMYRKPRSPEKSEADRMLEDLRSHLLSKRNKMEAEMARRAPKYQHQEKRQLHERRREHREHRRNVEDIDSPENYGDQQPSGSGRPRERYEDPEQAARKAKLLEIDRETSRRKEQAREELRARREMHREERRDDTKHHRHEDDGSVVHKRRKLAPESEEQVITVSDKSEESDSESDSSESFEDSQNSDEDDEDIPNSPLSVGDLSKSEHRHRNSSRNSSKSKTQSPGSASGSPSDGSASGSSDSEAPGSRASSRSPSKRERDAQIFQEEDEQPEKPPESAPEAENAVAEEKPNPADDLPSYFPALQGCRSVEEFQCLNRIEEGTYGVVYRAKDKRTEEIVALKRLKMEKEKEGFPITSLREINTLLKGQHPNIVTVREIVVGSNMDKIFIVMDYVEHDLKSLMETMKHKKQAFLPGEVKCLTQQLLRAVAHLHDIWILHRDLKTSNLLLSHKGILKVGDFGLAREYGSPLKPYTSVVVTLWYRAPELLLGCKEYSTPIDVWSVGCIFAEFLAMTALFPGKSEIDQLNRIFKDLGTPNEKIWPGYGELPAVQKMTFTEYPVSQLRKKFAHLTSELGLSLLQGLLTYDPKQRLTAEQALKSHYFKELPLSIDPAMFPTWPAKSELGVRKALASSPKPPSGGGQFKQLGEDGADNPSGFHLGGSLLESRQLAMGPGFSLKF